MKSIAEAFLRVSLYMAIITLFCFAIYGLAQVGLSSDGTVQSPKFLAICALLFILSVAIGLCGSLLDVIADHRATKEARERRRRGE